MTLKTIAIMGPTASGKTDLAIELHQALSADIISVDSALVYRGMDIGTAKPPEAVLKIAPHRLINVCDPSENYSAGQFCVDASQAVQAIFGKKQLPLLVGGTMLYFRELLYGIADLPKADPLIRAALEKKANLLGWAALHDELKRVDPAAAAKIKPQDPQRIQRALEVFLITGRPISVLQMDKTPLLPEENVIQIALIPEDRAWLHERIARRFEMMLTAGFIDEVKTLKARGDLHKDMPSMRVVGYRQALEYLEGGCDFESMKARAIAATRQLAKRQLTWLRSWKNTHVFDPQDPQLFEKVLSCIDKNRAQN